MNQLTSRPFFSVHVDPPTSPDVRVLRLFHRNPSSYAVFLHRPNLEEVELRTFKHLRVDKLPGGLTSAAAMRQDSYFSINGYRRWGTRKTADLSALNAAAVDLDFYRGESPLSWQYVVDTVNRSVTEGVIPLPSIVVNSGRGAWLVWLLVAEDDPSSAPSGRPVHQTFLRDINERLASIIVDRIPQFHVDAASAELTRCLRIPGSVNSKSGSYVNYLVHETPWGLPHSYSLHQLGKEIQVAPPTYNRPQRSLLVISGAEPNPRPRSRKRDGGRNLGRTIAKRLDEIERIEKSRNGFREGHRNVAVLITAVGLRTLHRPPEEIEAHVHELASRCHPPLATAQARAAAKVGRYRYGNAQIARLLGVSIEEAEALGLEHIRPDYTPRRPHANIRKGRKDTAVLRRAALKSIVMSVEETGDRELPPLRELQHRLANLGYSVTLTTITRDLSRLSLARRHVRGRRKRGARQLELLTP